LTISSLTRPDLLICRPLLHGLNPRPCCTSRVLFPCTFFALAHAFRFSGMTSGSSLRRAVALHSERSLKASYFSYDLSVVWRPLCASHLCSIFALCIPQEAHIHQEIRSRYLLLLFSSFSRDFSVGGCTSFSSLASITQSYKKAVSGRKSTFAGSFPLASRSFFFFCP